MIGMFRRFRRLLTRRHVAGPAWWSVVSRLPVHLMSLAMVLVVREQGGSYAQAGLVSALYTVGMALGSPFLARRADRDGRRGVLLATGLVYPPALAVLVWGTGPGTPGQLVLAVVAGAALPPANPCMRSLWARLPLHEEERETAYLWEALITELLAIGAPLILAVLMATDSAGTALTTIAALGGTGALGLALTPLPGEAGEKGHPARTEPGAPPSVLGPLREPPIRALTGVMVVAAVPIGLMTLAIPAFVDRHGTPGHTGVVCACWGIGSALGAVWLGRSQAEWPVHRRFPWLLLAYAAGTALPLPATSECTLGLALAVGGAPVALISVSEMVLVSTLNDSRLLTEAFTWASLATVAGQAVGQQLGGLLVEPLGPHGVFAAAVGASLVTALGAFACRGLFAKGMLAPIPATAG
ncbi:MFS transporter [Streptomyces celluloflavus]|uniref:MFS transporter n=1 Tax=Streptomyces celluloflavus TaxID=58344 RepID=UPI00345F1BE0|nr:MFS transporter [Streptomyces celluloflavus]